MSLLCWTRPPEWWDLGHEQNRLALAICRVCPVVGECGTGREPHGVILGGVAYTECGQSMAPCDTCGYPLSHGECFDGHCGDEPACQRCNVPPDAWPTQWTLRHWRIRRLVADGLKDKDIAVHLGISPDRTKKVRHQIRCYIPRNKHPERNAA